MGNAGQACNGTKRMIVVDELYDDFLEQFTAAMAGLEPGDPTDSVRGLRPALVGAGSAQPPRADPGRRRPRRHRGDRRRASGPARRLHAGHGAHRRDAPRCAPTTRSCSARRPSSTASPTPTRQSLSPTAPASAWVASCGVPTSPPPRRWRDRLDTGMVWINSPQGSMADLPFGGTKSLRRRPRARCLRHRRVRQQEARLRPGRLSRHQAPSRACHPVRRSRLVDGAGERT